MEQLGELMPSTQKIKISGDGAKMSRLTNFIVLSFSLLSDGEKVMSAKGEYYRQLVYSTLDAIICMVILSNISRF